MADIELNKVEFLSQSFKDLNSHKIELYHKLFEECQFHSCDFSDAQIVECKFVDCEFIQCNLSLVSVKDSRFSEVSFEGCKLVGVDWTKASWASIAAASPIRFYNCVMNDSCFYGLSLPELVMEQCKAHDVDFREGDFSEANFSCTDFSYSLFSHTNLSGADFSEATSYNIDIMFNEIKGAKFSRMEAIRLLESLEIELVD